MLVVKLISNEDEIAEALQQEYDPEECRKYFLKHNPVMKKIIEEESGLTLAAPSDGKEKETSEGC
jgi:hypothetical protein